MGWDGKIYAGQAIGLALQLMYMTVLGFDNVTNGKFSNV